MKSCIICTRPLTYRVKLSPWDFMEPLKVRRWTFFVLVNYKDSGPRPMSAVPGENRSSNTFLLLLLFYLLLCICFLFLFFVFPYLKSLHCSTNASGYACVSGCVWVDVSERVKGQRRWPKYYFSLQAFHSQLLMLGFGCFYNFYLGIENAEGYVLIAVYLFIYLYAC